MKIIDKLSWSGDVAQALLPAATTLLSSLAGVARHLRRGVS
jgi:hypothetical protein